MIPRGFSLFLAALALPLLLSAAASQSDPPMTDRMEWKGRIVVEFQESLGDIQPTLSPSGVALLGYENLDALARQFHIHNIRKAIPTAQKPLNPAIRDISRYYYLEFPNELDPRQVAEAYGSEASVITAETCPVRRPDFVPNDPFYSYQWAMTTVHAALGYDYYRGENPIVIGIVDSGTDTTHPDLRSNLWVNPEEDLNHNGVIEPNEWNYQDEDLNGHVDDFWGWNYLVNNNDVQDPPEALNGGHGTHCAGDASAVFNNGIGITSLGATAKIITARCGDGVVVFWSWPEGVEYCVSEGAKIVSLSFGGSVYNAYEQSIINNVTAQGAIVVAAAGNDNTSAYHYPSAYENVVSVAATSSGDYKASFSNYGTWIDVSAPGSSIYSTVPGGYNSYDGTSMACPITAGLIASIWSANASLTQNQVLDILYSTCVNIDAQNPSYIGQLGHGRIDAGAALGSMFPNISLFQVAYDDTLGGNGDGRPDPGETVDMIITLRNGSTTITAVGVTATIGTSDTTITLIQGGSTYGDILPNTNQNNLSNPIRFSVNEFAEAHFCTFDLTLNSQSLNYPIQSQFSQMIGRPDVLVVSDDGANNYSTWYSLDLDCLQVIHDVWDVYSRGEINQDEVMRYENVIWHTSTADDPLSTNEQGLIQYYLNHNGKLFLTGEDIDEQLAGTTFYSNVLRCNSLNAAGSYQLTGVSGNPVSQGTTLFLVGGTGANNSQSPSAIEPINGANLVYTYNISGQGSAINWEDGSSGLVYFAFNFEAASGLAGSTARRVVLNNILYWFGTVSPVAPQVGLDQSPLTFDLEQNYPNPFNPTTVLHYQLRTAGQVQLRVYDTAGRLVRNLVEGQKSAGVHQAVFEGFGLTSGIYLARLEAGGSIFTRKMILLK